MKNEHTYLYVVRSYRGIGEVKHIVRYIGKEIERQKIKILLPKYRMGIGKMLDSSAQILFHVTDENEFIIEYENTFCRLTYIPKEAMKMVILAAECIARRGQPIHIHTGIPELKEMEIKDVLRLLKEKILISYQYLRNPQLHI